MQSPGGRLDAPVREGGAATAPRDLLTRGRVAHLATADQYARPHAIPVVFVWVEPYLYTPLDRKRKRSGDPRDLRRAKDIEANGRVSVVIDHWDEDWAELEWVRVDGTAEILDSGAERDLAAAALLAKYPQYHDLPLEACPVVKVTAERVTEWPET